MSISFNQVPSNLRVPLFFAEFDNSRAVQGGALQEYKTLMIGPKLAAGTKAALSAPELITNEDQAKELFGAGSVLADMAAKYLANTKIIPLYCVAVDDLVAGVKATGKFTFSGVPTKAGVISLMVGGKNVKIGASTTDTASTLATALAAAIQADADLVVNAATNANPGEVVITAKNKGEQGNEIDLSHSYFTGEELPAGVALAITGMADGAGNPDLTDVWPVLGESQYLLFVSPYTDAANLIATEAELADRFGPLRQNDGYGLYAKRGTVGTLSTFGNSRNSQFTTVLGMKGPSSPWQFAAAMAGQIGLAAQNDPARPFQTLVLTEIYAPKKADQFTLEERNGLLFHGIATFFVDAGGYVNLETIITTYKKNAFGSPDISYLYLNTLLTLSYLRFDLKARITSRFPRHKLANDGGRYAPGQAVVTPNSVKAEVIAKFREWEEKALVENFSQFKNDLIVERNKDNPNRLDILMSPDTVNQLIVVGCKIQFIL